MFSCDDDAVSVNLDSAPSLQNTLNQDLEGASGNIDEYFYDLENDEIDDDYEYYDNLALSLQQGEIPLNFATFSCFLTKLSSDDLTLDLVTRSIEPDSSYEKHIVRTVTVSTPSYQNIPNMEWSEDNGRYIPQTQTVASDSKDFYFIEDFGSDGCPDSNEDGNGGCSNNLNPDFIDGGEDFIDAFNGVHDPGEYFLDYGTDGCTDDYEDGVGGCLNFSNPDCEDDPNGDNGVTENNGIWDSGEYLYDEKNGIYDCSVCDLNDPNYDGEQFDDDNGNGFWDSGDPNNDNASGDEGDGVLNNENNTYIDCENYNTEAECVDADGDGSRDGFCEWTMFLQRADCSGAGDDCDPYIRQNPGVYDDGEDFIDVNNNEEWDSYCLDIVSNEWDSSYLIQEDCNGAADRNWVEESFVDAGVYVEGCKHYSDRAEYKVYRVTYDQATMGEVEGQYYIDRDEWVRKDSTYSRSKLEYEHTFTQTKIRPSSQELMSRVNADCNENNQRDDAEIYVQDESGCSDFENFIYKPETFTDDGADQCPDQFEDGNGGCNLSQENLGADGCPDQFEDGYGGCYEFTPSSYIEGTDPNGDNDHNGDNYDCGADGICPCDADYDSPDSDGSEGVNGGTECNGVYDLGEDFENKPSGTPGVYDTGFCDRSNQIWDPVEAHLDLESAPNGIRNATEPYQDRNCNGQYTIAEIKGPQITSQECADTYNGTWIVSGEGLNGEDFDFCDVGNGQFDGDEVCRDGSVACNGSELYSDAEKQYGALLVSYGGYSCTNPTSLGQTDYRWYSTEQDCQSDYSCDDGSECVLGGSACSDGSECSAFCQTSCELDSPKTFETITTELDIFDRWGNEYVDIIEKVEETKLERESVDLIDSIVVVYSNPIIEKLDSNYDYDYTIAKSKWEDGGETDYDYHIFRKSDEGYIMKLVHPSYFLPSESFASGNSVSTGGAFWFQEEPEEEVFLYTVNGELRDGERYQTSRVDITPVAEYLVEESYAVDAESYAAPLRSFLGVEVNGCDIICAYDENETGFTNGVSNDVNLNGVWDEGEVLTLDVNGDGNYDEGDEFVDWGDICYDCATIEDCPSDIMLDVFKVSKEKTTTLLGTGVEYVESNTSYFAKDFGLIRDDSEFRWNVPPGESQDLEGKFRWVMVNKNDPEPSDCSEEAGFFNAFINNKKVISLDEFDQIDDSYHPYKKTRTYGLQRIDKERESQ